MARGMDSAPRFGLVIRSARKSRAGRCAILLAPDGVQYIDAKGIAHPQWGAIPLTGEWRRGGTRVYQIMRVYPDSPEWEAAE